MISTHWGGTTTAVPLDGNTVGGIYACLGNLSPSPLRGFQAGGHQADLLRRKPPPSRHIASQRDGHELGHCRQQYCRVIIHTLSYIQTPLNLSYAHKPPTCSNAANNSNITSENGGARALLAPAHPAAPTALFVGPLSSSQVSQPPHVLYISAPTATGVSEGLLRKSASAQPTTDGERSERTIDRVLAAGGAQRHRPPLAAGADPTHHVVSLADAVGGGRRRQALRHACRRCPARELATTEGGRRAGHGGRSTCAPPPCASPAEVGATLPLPQRSCWLLALL
jgi:hypothetical protein